MALNTAADRAADYVLFGSWNAPFDFLRMPDTLESIPREHPAYGTALRRTDLALLRRAVTDPHATVDWDRSNTAGWARLLGHKLVEFGEFGRIVPTPYGLETCRANASCRDGTERPRQAA